MKTMNLEHVYSFYPLYHSMWGRYGDVHRLSASRAAFGAEQYAIKYPHIVKEGLTVCETLSGRMEHRPHFIDMIGSGLKINAYEGVDIEEHTAEFGSTVGDAFTADYPTSNYVVSYFYSLASIAHTPERLQELFNNVARNLRRNKNGGAWFFHAAENGYANAFQTLDYTCTNLEVGLHANSPMRRHFKLTFADKAYVRFTIRHTYDRWTGVSHEEVRRAELWVNGAPHTRFVVKHPMSFRYWSEPEMMDAARRAGFDEAFYLRCTADDLATEYNVLTPKVRQSQLTEAEGDLDKLMPTDIVAVIKPQGRTRRGR